MASQEQQFLQSLTWVQCNACLCPFSATTRFLILDCFHTILCEHCAKKFKKNEKPPSITCLMCRKDKHATLIRHSMNPEIRQFFGQLDGSLQNAARIQKFQEAQENYNLQKMERENGKIRDIINAQRGKLINMNKERESCEQQNEQLEQMLLQSMSSEKFNHYMGKTLEELENVEKNLLSRQKTSKPENFERSYHQHPQSNAGFRPADAGTLPMPQRHRQQHQFGSESTSNMNSVLGSRSTASSRKTLRQTVQEKNFRKHFSPLLSVQRPEYTSTHGHHQQTTNHYQTQGTQIRTMQQKQAREDAERIEQFNQSTSTNNRVPSMVFKREN